MNKNIKRLAFVLLLFFIVGALAVFAISVEEYNQYYSMGYNSGFNYASGTSSSSPPGNGSTAMNNAYSRAGLGTPTRANAELRGAFREGFVAGFYAQKAGR